MTFSKITLFYTQLRSLLIRRHKFQLVLLVFLAIGLSLVETAAVSAIMPFISIATNTDLLDRGIYKQIFDTFHFVHKNSFVIALGFVIIGFYVFRALYNVAYTYILSRFSFGVFRYFSEKLFRIYLSLPYLSFIQRNSSELTQHIVTEANNTGMLLLSVLHVFAEAFTVLLLYGFMVAIQWQITLVLTGILGLVVLLVLTVVLRMSRRQGIRRAEAYKKVYQILAETFGNFKFIRLKGNGDSMIQEFTKFTQRIAQAQRINSVLGIIPRCILESTGFALIIGTVNFILWRYRSAETIIPVISLYALSLYRILPAATRMLTSINQISFFQRSLEIVYDDIHQETLQEGNDALGFTKTIRINNLSFNYIAEQKVLQDVSLLIHKGEKVAVVGESGSGKSTLIDVLIGLHKPVKGVLYVDDVAVTDANVQSWRRKIGYIPQNIYLFDGTVGANVSFGSVTDKNRIIEVLKMANIWDFLQEREGIDTRVGEGGIQLSGGQKQRIGIARALYTNPDVLVLDEATSALDTETETKIMDEIYRISTDKTLIVIAHRLTTVERCDRRIAIEEGRLAG
ncbi:MAG: ABC transporter ATP-binding protein [Prevotella sp.]|jgi:ATP-binding cassette subfamily B protein/ATP-binding cassette subfamily C protein|nr:ABC transporter ATP-binding protein [Prevotella sp.]